MAWPPFDSRLSFSSPIIKTFMKTELNCNCKTAGLGHGRTSPFAIQAQGSVRAFYSGERFGFRRSLRQVLSQFGVMARAMSPMSTQNGPLMEEALPKEMGEVGDMGEMGEMGKPATRGKVTSTQNRILYINT